MQIARVQSRPTILDWHAMVDNRHGYLLALFETWLAVRMRTGVGLPQDPPRPVVSKRGRALSLMGSTAHRWRLDQGTATWFHTVTLRSHQGRLSDTNFLATEYCTFNPSPNTS